MAVFCSEAQLKTERSALRDRVQIGHSIIQKSLRSITWLKCQSSSEGTGDGLAGVFIAGLLPSYKLAFKEHTLG